MGRLNVYESSYNQFYQQYDDNVQESEIVYPVCLFCQKESVSLNTINECVQCEMARDRLDLRLSELSLNQVGETYLRNNVLCWNGKRLYQ